MEQEQAIENGKANYSCLSLWHLTGKGPTKVLGKQENFQVKTPLFTDITKIQSNSGFSFMSIDTEHGQVQSC